METARNLLSNGVSSVMTFVRSRSMFQLLIIGIVILSLVCYLGYCTYCWCGMETFQGEANARFLYFYLPSCPHCVAMKPEWEKLRNNHGEVFGAGSCTIKLMGVDGSESINNELLDTFNVESFPTLVLDREGKEPVEFDGERTEEGFMKFLNQHCK